VIPIPTELTISGLLLEGQSKIAIFIILVSGSILGGFIAYYIGYGGIGFLKRLRKKPSKKSEDTRNDLSCDSILDWELMIRELNNIYDRMKFTLRPERKRMGENARR